MQNEVVKPKIDNIFDIVVDFFGIFGQSASVCDFFRDFWTKRVPNRPLFGTTFFEKVDLP